MRSTAALRPRSTRRSDSEADVTTLALFCLSVYTEERAWLPSSFSETDTCLGEAAHTVAPAWPNNPPS